MLKPALPPNPMLNLTWEEGWALEDEWTTEPPENRQRKDSQPLCGRSGNWAFSELRPALSSIRAI